MAVTGLESLDQSQRLEVIKNMVDHPLPTLKQTTDLEGTTFNLELTKRISELTLLGELLLPTAETLCAELKLIGTEELPFDVVRFKSLVSSVNITIRAFKLIHNQIGHDMPMSDNKLSQLAFDLGIYDSSSETSIFLSSLNKLSLFASQFYENIEISVSKLDTEVREIINIGIGFGVLAIKGREFTVTRNLADSFEIQY